MSLAIGTFGYDGTRQCEVATDLYGGWMVINDDFWHEFMKWAVAFNNVKKDADIYDVFSWIRQRQPGATPFSDKFLEKIDKEIEKELGPWK